MISWNANRPTFPTPRNKGHHSSLSLCFLKTKCHQQASLTISFNSRTILSGCTSTVQTLPLSSSTLIFMAITAKHVPTLAKKSCCQNPSSDWLSSYPNSILQYLIGPCLCFWNKTHEFQHPAETKFKNVSGRLKVNGRAKNSAPKVACSEKISLPACLWES